MLETGEYEFPLLSISSTSRGEGVRDASLGRVAEVVVSSNRVLNVTNNSVDDVFACRLTSVTEYARWQSISQKYFSWPIASVLAWLLADNPTNSEI